MNLSQYEVLREIGGGQQARVFLASTDGQLVALKHLETEGQEELELLTAIRHPGVVRLLGALEGPTLVLEYASEGDLAGYVKRRFAGEHVPEAVVRSWLLQLLLALQHLHSLHVVHRDLKLLNVLVLGNGQLRVADFGLAQRTNGEECTRSAVGTPYYLSPETLTSSRCSTKSDMWALGCLLYEVCTGEKPFQGAALGDIVRSILEQPAQEIPSCYSRWLSDLIRSLLDKNSQKRPSAQAVLEEEEMQREFVLLRSAYREYEKLSYPHGLKTAKHFTREILPASLSQFSESLKTAKRERSIRLPGEEEGREGREGREKRVERTKFAHLSLRSLLERRERK